MKLKEILAISGQSGLYKFVAQSKNGIIVEQLGSGVRSCASASAKVSSLGEIAIFTENDDVPLAQVFQQIYDKHAGQPVLSHKSAPEDLKKFIRRSPSRIRPATACTYRISRKWHCGTTCFWKRE